MRKVHLSLACGDYELTRPLIEGVVQPEGIELTVITTRMPERNWRMSLHEEFDVCEYSLAGYTIAKSRGRRFTGIPVFLHRRFRHSYVFCRTGAGIRRPADLEGKRVGLRMYLATAGVWARGILKHEYGVPTETIQWFTKDPEDVPLDFERFRRHVVRQLPPGQEIEDVLLAGDLDAVIYPESLPSARGEGSAVHRLFADPKAEEIAYHRKTGIFPIMHVTVIKDDVVSRYPWVPRSLLKAFEQAKQICYQRMADPRRFPFAWIMLLGEEQEALLGRDPWAYGLERNRRALDTFLGYMVEQEMVPTRFAAEELFHPSTIGDVPAY